MVESGAEVSQALSYEDLWDAWVVLSIDDKTSGFELLSRDDQEEFFIALSPRDQVALLETLPIARRRMLVRALAPDDAADMLQAADEDQKKATFDLFPAPMREEVTALLADEEDVAAGLMSTRYARVRPDMTVGEAIGYLRKQAR